MRESKGRMIRRDISRSQKFAALSKDSQVLFCMIIPHLNAHGKMNGSSYFIKGEVCPLIEYLSVKDIEKCLKEINEKTNMKWFFANGLWWVASLSWDEHQDIEVQKRGLDRIPHYNEPNQVADKSPISREKVEHEVEVEVKAKLEAKDVLQYFNEKANRQYKPLESNLKYIFARFKDGFSASDCKKVIDTKVSQWLNDPAMDMYLRPQTVFGGKFEGYLNEKSAEKKYVSHDHPCDKVLTENDIL